ncbi:MAG: hypothetical protein JWO72_2190 [Caulobacteraceae bacterium]|nr:hypothetical protein [Caulobacteraceae bacterium]
MRLNRFAAALALTTGMGALGFGMSGCNSAAQALGITKVTPDEFRVVTKAPLTVPPDYAMRPPAPGEPRPQELQPESAARNALLGARSAESRSDGEKLLAAKAGGDKADPLVRYVVDDEFGDLAHKEPSFADRVLFWRKDKPTASPAATAAVAGAVTAAPLDPATEAARLKSLTGDKPVRIQRDQTGGPTKLPGL